jgi:hypothetical protein
MEMESVFEKLIDLNNIMLLSISEDFRFMVKCISDDNNG